MKNKISWEGDQKSRPRAASLPTRTQCWEKDRRGKLTKDLAPRHVQTKGRNDDRLGNTSELRNLYFPISYTYRPRISSHNQKVWEMGHNGDWVFLTWSSKWLKRCPEKTQRSNVVINYCKEHKIMARKRSSKPQRTKLIYVLKGEKTVRKCGISSTYW